MKNKLSILICNLLIIATSNLMAQDARFYYEGTNYTGPYKDLKLGETIYVNSDGDDISIKIFNPNIAIKATRVDGNWKSYRPGSSENYFVYTERSMPKISGTDQYSDINIRVECIPKANSWQELPQPQIYVPFNITDANPNSDNDHHLKKYVHDHKMLVLRRAFIWENSEAIGGFHGPYGDVKIEAWDPFILSFSESQLLSSWQYIEPTFRISSSELPGPIWSGYQHFNPYPDPYDEWVDGPFGCIYSNIAVYDWDAKGAKDSIAVAIAEADSPNSFMGTSSIGITKNTQGEILIKVWGYGFVILQNITVPSSGVEQKVSRGNVYWYGGWNGNYPVEVYGPQNAAVPCEKCPGNQFRPYTDDQYFSFNSNPAFYGYHVGLEGGTYPKGIYSEPRTFHAIDKPVKFGDASNYKPSGVWLFSESNYKGSSRFIPADASDLGNSLYQFLDKASSIKLVNVQSAVLYNGIYFFGQYAGITNDSPTLDPTFINDKVKSIKIYR